MITVHILYHGRINYVRMGFFQVKIIILYYHIEFK